MEMMRQIDVRETLPLVTCPTIVIASSEDEIAPAEMCRWIADQIPDARYAEIEGPHFPVWPGHGERLTALIEEYLTGAAVAVPVSRALSTVLFTDIVSSTDTATRLGDQRRREILEAHDRLAARLVENHGGNLVKSTGDGILATFDGPGRAVRCALAFATAAPPPGSTSEPAFTVAKSNSAVTATSAGSPSLWPTGSRARQNRERFWCLGW